MIKLITFDLDNTLWDVNPVIRRADNILKQWMSETQPEVLDHYNTKTFALVKKKVSQEQPDSLHLPTPFRKHLLCHCYSQIGLDGIRLEQQVEDAFKVFHTARNEIEFYPGTIPLLRKLNEDFDLIALSNGNADLQMAGLGDYFRGHFSADSTGKPKPDPTMFLAALDHAGVAPKETIHIGDHQKEDVDAAQKLGFRTIWFNENGKQAPKICSPDREVCQLNQIVSVIQGLLD